MPCALKPNIARNMNTNITPHLGSVSNGNPDQAIVNTVSVPCLNFGLAMYLVPRRPRRAPKSCLIGFLGCRRSVGLTSQARGRLFAPRPRYDNWRL